jgi:hypothetical protein
VTHPDPLAIIRALHRVDSPEGRALSDHLSRCSSCAAEVQRIEEMLVTLRAGASAGDVTAECLDEELLAAVADGSVDAEVRDRALPHLATCGHCRRAVASLASALNDPAVAAAAGKGRGSVRRWSRLAIPAAAAAVLAIAVLGHYEAGPLKHRGPPITQATQPEAISPLGLGSRPAQLRWGSVSEAELYRVTLFQADGRVLYEVEARDTSVVLPDSVRLMPGGSYLWKVEARTGWNRWSASRLFEFSVSAAP